MKQSSKSMQNVYWGKAKITNMLINPSYFICQNPEKYLKL